MFKLTIIHIFKRSGKLLMILALINVLVFQGYCQDFSSDTKLVKGSRGISWWVKSTDEAKHGPGPNWFSDSPENVFVDAEGLHLRIRKEGDRWYCSEIYVHEDDFMGYGEYIFYTNTDFASLDRHIVSSFFIYDYKNTSNEELFEFDIEISHWSKPPTHSENKVGHFVLQPNISEDGSTNPTQRFDSVKYEFKYPDAENDNFAVTHKFWWVGKYVFFRSYKGHSPTLQNADDLISEWLTEKEGVISGNEVLHINFWLNNGRAPKMPEKGYYEFLINDIWYPDHEKRPWGIIQPDAKIEGPDKAKPGSIKKYRIDDTPPSEYFDDYHWTFSGKDATIIIDELGEISLSFGKDATSGFLMARFYKKDAVLGVERFGTPRVKFITVK